MRGRSGFFFPAGMAIRLGVGLHLRHSFFPTQRPLRRLARLDHPQIERHVQRARASASGAAGFYAQASGKTAFAEPACGTGPRQCDRRHLQRVLEEQFADGRDGGPAGYASAAARSSNT